jgi:hypothetical protein
MRYGAQGVAVNLFFGLMKGRKYPKGGFFYIPFKPARVYDFMNLRRKKILFFG